MQRLEKGEQTGRVFHGAAYSLLEAFLFMAQGDTFGIQAQFGVFSVQDMKFQPQKLAQRLKTEPTLQQTGYKLAFE